MPEILKKSKYIPLSELPNIGDEVEQDSDVAVDFFLRKYVLPNLPSDMPDNTCGIVVVHEEDGNKIDNDFLMSDPNFCKEHPLTLDNMRFPYDPNTGKPTIDLDHIMLNRKLMRAINGMACFKGSVMSEYHGGGSEYEDVVSLNGRCDTLVATKSRRIKKPDSSRSNLDFGYIPDVAANLGVGHPLAKHVLNRTAVNERVSDIMEKYPNEENLRDNAWATALDENLRRAVRRSGKELLLIRHEPRFDIAKAALYVIGATMSIPIPIAVPSIYATDTIMAYREAKKMGMGLKDLQFSLFPPICMHPDRYLALLAMTSDATPLIEYRKK